MQDSGLSERRRRAREARRRSRNRDSANTRYLIEVKFKGA